MMNMIFSGMLFLALPLALFLMTVLLKATYVVGQSEVVIIERLGKFHSILHPGIHFVIPFLDAAHEAVWVFVTPDSTGRRTYRHRKVIKRIDLRESVYDFPKQNVITKDNVTMEINALLYYQITDPKRAVYEIHNLPEAIEKLTQTKLRDVIGSMDLDETLSSRDMINTKLRETLDDATDKWGVKVNRVELQEVSPPMDIREAMEKQMRAERTRRAILLEADGEKMAAILHAEGDRQSRLERAKGEAESRLIVAKAEADSIKVIAAALPSKDPSAYIIANKYIKALPEMTGGKDSKLVLLPYESSALTSSVAAIKEIFQHGGKK